MVCPGSLYNSDWRQHSLFRKNLHMSKKIACLIFVTVHVPSIKFIQVGVWGYVVSHNVTCEALRDRKPDSTEAWELTAPQWPEVQPAQGCGLHGLVSDGGLRPAPPTQRSLPSSRGRRSGPPTHVTLRPWVPPPQLAEQGDQAATCHLPTTTTEEEEETSQNKVRWSPINVSLIYFPFFMFLYSFFSPTI